MSVSTAHNLLTMVAAVALLGGCAEPAPPASTAATPQGPTPLVSLPPPLAPLPEPTPRVSSVLGTPFLIAFKVPACIASAIVSAPVAALYTLANQGAIPPEQDLYEDVDRANETYCGEPWTIPP
ncbi:MAG TPA: hypothetical protein VLX09_13355 [Stellaceae bacterium]|nr:hypothetical protein [Stellaceae bacterium]